MIDIKYTGKHEFRAMFPLIHLKMSFYNMHKGVMEYNAVSAENDIVVIKTSMNDNECNNYFNSETIEELSNTDNFEVRVNGITVFNWIKNGKVK